MLAETRPERVAALSPEWVADLTQESVADFRPESMAEFTGIRSWVSKPAGLFVINAANVPI